MSLLHKIFHPHVPTLSEKAFLRYFSFSALYMAQGIPHGITYFGIPAWLAMNGKGVGEIAAFAGILAIPWTFKFIIAPFIDRYTYLPMGRRRPWVLFGQVGLLLSMVAMAGVKDPLNNLDGLMITGFLVSFFSAFQDVATDSMAIDIIPLDEQARANGLMWGSKTIGISASLATGSWLINNAGFAIAMLTMATGIFVIMMIPLIMRERPGEKFMPWMHGKSSPISEDYHLDGWGEILGSLWHVMRLPYSLLLILLLFIMGAAYNFMNTLIPIFTVQNLNWTDEEYSQVYSGASLFAGIIGMIIGGYLIDHFGKIRMISIYYLMLILLTGGMAYYEVHWLNSHFTTAFIFIYTTLYVFSTIGLLAMAMKFCWRKVSATQFTIYMTISNLGFSLGPVLINPVKERYGWEVTIFCFAIIVSTVLILLQFMRTRVYEHQLEVIEEEDLLVHHSPLIKN